MGDSYLTVAAELCHEGEPIKGSRFVATVAPARGPGEARGVIERVGAEFADARHLCWAWRLGPGGERYRSSDAGEPGGSAGRPILAQLEGRGVSDAVALVARYFGGVRLGVGGLMRAYGGVVGRCLDRARLVEVQVTRRVSIQLPYGCCGAVEGLLRAEGLEAAEARYGERVELQVDVPQSRLEAFARDLAERTGGRARMG